MALNKSELNSVGNNTLKTILQLVRYDIPVLVVGKSSIGKSYTIIEITEKWRLPSSILYIGSEKPENIEGLAKLISGDYETKKDAKGKNKNGEPIMFDGSRWLILKDGDTSFNSAGEPIVFRYGRWNRDPSRKKGSI